MQQMTSTLLLVMDFNTFHYLMAWASNNRGEDSPGGIISGETGFAHAGAIVNDKSGGIFVTHLVWLELLAK